MVLNQDRRDEETGYGRSDAPDAPDGSERGDSSLTTEPATGPAGEPFDPNYDPAFQRGYTPHPGEGRRTRLRNAADDSPYRRPASAAASGGRAGADRPAAPAHASASPDTTFGDDTLASDELERFPESEGQGEPGRDPEPYRVADRTGSAVVITGASILDRAEISPRRNPYFLALWIMGGGFVVLGIVLYAVSVYSSYTSTTDAQDVSTLVFSQVGWMLAGPLVTVGLGTIVALVLLTALRTHSRRHARTDSGVEGP
jgi:hypothetical protein